MNQPYPQHAPAQNYGRPFGSPGDCASPDECAITAQEHSRMMGKPERRRSIPSRLHDITDEAAILDKLVGELDQQIQPILRQEPPPPPVDNCKPGTPIEHGPNCSLDEKLCEIRRQFRDANRRLQYLINHIEI